MARMKEFEPDAVLDAAMRLFWRQGYEGTSTSMLVQELGIGRGSLYATFGSKRELYLAALEKFMTGAAGPSPGDLLTADGSVLDAVRAFLMRSAEDPPEDMPYGCFAVNATVEHGDVDPEIARRLEMSRRSLESAFYSVLLRARAEGELAPDVDPKSSASMLVALNTGLKVLSRAGLDQRDRIRVTVDAVMSTLERAPDSV